MKRTRSSVAGPSFPQPAQRLARSLRMRGVRRTLRRIGDEISDFVSRALHGRSPYERWFFNQVAELGTGGLSTTAVSSGPRISILMPVFETDPRWLERAIESVERQSHSAWELCITDDASTRPEVASILKRAVARDSRIRVQLHERRLGISAASNTALQAATGEYTAFLDHDDELAPEALLEVARVARERPFDVLYTDEDKIAPAGHLRDPAFKPDYSDDLLMTCNFMGHLVVYRTELLRELGGLDSSFDGAQDHDLALRAAERTSRIVHLPRVLYHWRMTEGSAARPDENSKKWAFDAGRRAIEARLGRVGIAAEVVPTFARGYWRVVRPLDPEVRVSVLVRRTSQCAIASDAAHELIAIEESDAFREGILAERWNRAAEAATGEVLIFLDDVIPRSPGWAEELAAQALRPEIGAVGARISSRDGRLLHMGAVFGGPEVIRTDSGLGCNEPGHLGLAQSPRDVAAVTGGCLAVRSVLFRELGGFDTAYRSALFDIDFCMKVRARGLRVLYDPHAEFEHPHVGLPEPEPEDVSRFAEHWRDAAEEPYSNPAFRETGRVLVPVYRGTGVLGMDGRR